jgi:putative ABC transport system permease protein
MHRPQAERVVSSGLFDRTPSVDARKHAAVIALRHFLTLFTPLSSRGLGVCGLTDTLPKMQSPSCAAMVTHGNLQLTLDMGLFIAGISSAIGIRR